MMEIHGRHIPDAPTHEELTPAQEALAAERYEERGVPASPRRGLGGRASPADGDVGRTRYEAHAIAIEKGILSRTEVRGHEDLPADASPVLAHRAADVAGAVAAAGPAPSLEEGRRRRGLIVRMRRFDAAGGRLV